MKWSRDEVPSDEVVVGYPNGIRALLDLKPRADEEAQQEQAMGSPPVQAQPLGLPPANARALVAWQMLGISLFASNRNPSLREVANEARGVALALEMERKDKNITRVASALNTSRRAVRRHMQEAGMYEWTRDESDADTNADEATSVREEARLDAEG